MRPMKVFVGCLILWVLCAIMLLISFIGESPNMLLISISLGVMFVGYAAFIILYRCPHCGRLLLNRVAPWHYCPHCGNHLNEEPTSYSYEVEEDKKERRSDGLNIQ